MKRSASAALSVPDSSDEDKPAVKRARSTAQDIQEDLQHYEEAVPDDHYVEAEDDAAIEAGATQLAKQEKREEKDQGKAAQAGIVKSIEVTDFMCHPKMTLRLGDRINFIVGHNGSGKSAFMTALQIALGAKAVVTGRGNGLKELVRNAPECTKATITIRLANKGLDAHRPEVYGESILITRTISRETGGGGYKIAAHDGSVVSKKRTELQAIIDTFKIEVDNPVSFLSQDNARQFLHNATPHEKYVFFLRGTLLQQLTEEYAQPYDLNKEIKDCIGKQRQELPNLKKDVDKATQRQRAAGAAHIQAAHLEEAKNRLAWAFVSEIEDTMEDRAAKIPEEQERATMIENRLEKCKIALDEANESFTDLEAKVSQAQASKDTLVEELDEIRRQLRESGAELKRLGAEGRQMKSAIEEAEERVAAFKSQLELEMGKNTQDDNGLRQQQKGAIEAMKEQSTGLRKDLAVARQNLELLHNTAEHGSEEYRVLKTEINHAQSDLEECNQKISQAGRGRSDPLAPYRGNIKGVLAAIQQDNGWVGTKPLGPLGTYITLKDQQWSNTIDTVLGGQLTGFVCSSRRDVKKMSNILKRFNLIKCPVFAGNYNPHLEEQLHQVDPGPQFTTVYKVLSFSHELVRSIIVDITKPESAILVTDRLEGERIMMYPPEYVRTCYTPDGFRLGGVEGGKQSTALNLYGGLPRLTKDTSAAMARFEKDKQQATSRLQDLNRKRTEMDARLKSVHDRKRDAKLAVRSLEDQDRKIANDIGALEDQMLISEPVSVAHLEDQLNEHTAKAESGRTQFQASRERWTALSRRNHPLVTERERLDARKLAIEPDVARHRAKAQRALDVKNQCQSDVQQYESKLEKQKAKVAALEAAWNTITDQLEARTEEAAQICARDSVTLDLNKTAKAYQADVRALTKALSMTTKRQGVSVDLLNAEVARSLEIQKKAKQSIKDLTELFKALNAAYISRSDRWVQLRKMFTVLARMEFTKYMSLRGYIGKMIVDYEEETLKIWVKTEEGNGRKKAPFKNADSLSGGEKSFSTVSLLLTLWACFSCPIRVLDEFDVYMDSVTRYAAMSMLIEGARMSNGRQHILISPNAVTNISFGPDLRVHKVADPQRNQGRLTN